MKFNKLESLRQAVKIYECIAENSKNPYRKASYEAIKGLCKGLEYFISYEQHACGAILPFMKTALELTDIDKK